jgi:hypothetical protein
MPSTVGPSGVQTIYTKSATINLAQVAGTYTLLTATGDVVIQDITFYVNVAGLGLVSVVVKTSDSVQTTLLASVLLAALVAATNLTPFNALTYLPSTKAIQYTIVGTGTAGSIQVLVRYSQATPGAFLS